jgi:hypothetical protein
VALVTTDWKKITADAWDAPSWKEAVEQYHRDRAGRPLIVEIEPERLKRLRESLKDSTSFLHAYYEIRDRRNGGAPQPTVEALMFDLRERGTEALEESATKRRLSELNDQQVIEIGNRLQRLRPEIARKSTADEVKLVFEARCK